MRCVRVLIAIVVLAVACAPATTESSSSTEPAEGPVETTTTTAASTTTERPVPPSQPVLPGDPQDAPAVLRYGWDGVSRVEGGAVQRLIEEPVSWAVDDGAGGVVFRTVADEPGWAWLKADADRPRRIELGETGWPHIVMVALVDGQPAALVSRTFDGMSQCEQDDFVEELVFHDLATGTERFVMCHGIGVDGGEQLASYGDGLLATVVWAELAGRTATVVGFYDLGGTRVDLAHNPFSESCAPCHLSVALSPDGRQLAFAHWPTAYWPDGYPTEADARALYGEWYSQSRDIPTEVAVIDLATGSESFRLEMPADVEVVAFDGRVLAIASPAGQTLYDLEALTSYQMAPASTGQRDFWTVILASLDHTVTSYDDAQARAGRFSTDLNSPTGVLWSDGFITLNPGYWAVFTGHFDNQAGAASLCRSLDVSCYSRYVATAETIDPELGWDMLVLEPDGLGLLSFGAPEWEVLELFERLVGSPPTGSYDEAGWVEYVGWEDDGLYLGFSRQWHEGFADSGPQFIGWQYIGGDLRTNMGVRVGMTLAELRSIYGDDVVVLGPDECGPAAYVIIDEILVVLHPDIGVVQGMFAGMQTGC